MNEFHATDIVIAKIIYDINIIAYEHKLLFYQDKKFGSHIEGSIKSVPPICKNIKSSSLMYARTKTLGVRKPLKTRFHG